MTTYHGIAYRPRGPGRRSRRSSRRTNDRPGRAGKPHTGRRAAGDSDGPGREVCEMQNAETILGIIRECGVPRGHPYWTADTTRRLGVNHRRAACGESLQARFGGGPTEKARTTGTSPAAYPT